MAGEADTNQIKALKWALFNIRVIGGYRQKNSILSYITITSLFLVISFMVADLILNVNGIESLRRVTFLPSLFVVCIKLTLNILCSNYKLFLL